MPHYYFCNLSLRYFRPRALPQLDTISFKMWPSIQPFSTTPRMLDGLGIRLISHYFIQVGEQLIRHVAGRGFDYVLPKM